MNIKDVYLCDIYMKNNNHPIFIKKAIVYWKKNGMFIDLETNLKYKAGYSIAKNGEFFVNLIGAMTSIYNSVIVSKKNCSKRKILSLVKENINYIEINECRDDDINECE